MLSQKNEFTYVLFNLIVQRCVLKILRTASDKISITVDRHKILVTSVCARSGEQTTFSKLREPDRVYLRILQPQDARQRSAVVDLPINEIGIENGREIYRETNW